MATTFEVWLALFVMIAVPTDFTGAGKGQFFLIKPAAKVNIQIIDSQENGVSFLVTRPYTTMRPAILDITGSDEIVYYLSEMSIHNEVIPICERIGYDLYVAVKFSDIYNDHHVEVRVPLYGQKEDDSENGGRPLIDSPIPEDQLTGVGRYKFQVDIEWMENALTKTFVYNVHETPGYSEKTYIGSSCNIERQVLFKLVRLFAPLVKDVLTEGESSR